MGPQGHLEAEREADSGSEQSIARVNGGHPPDVFFGDILGDACLSVWYPMGPQGHLEAEREADSGSEQSIARANGVYPPVGFFGDVPGDAFLSAWEEEDAGFGDIGM
jgi:hypothetical protein